MANLKNLRDDLKLAAYALACGLKVKAHLHRELSPEQFDDDGVPHDSLQFEIGDVHVWATARGWRVAQLRGGVYAHPTDSDFYAKLKPALDRAVEHWRDR